MRVVSRGLIAFALVLAWVSVSRTQEQPPPLRVHFVDVGQGDGILIQSPSGQNVVYDAGENPTRMRDYLTKLGISALSLVIASHNHADHIGGLPEILRLFRPPYYMENGVPATTQVYAQTLAAAVQAGSQLLEPTQRKITMGDASLSVVPPPRIADWDQNDNSIGIIVEYGSFRMSLAGDAEPREWAWQLTHQRELFQKVQIHKSSHHGSIEGDTVAGIEQLAPEAVVINVGEGNQYGHPDRETLRMYEAHLVKVYRTDLNGTIIVEAQTTGAYTVRVEKGEGAQPPPSPTPTPAPLPVPAPSPTPAPSPVPTGFSLTGVVQDATDSSRLSGVEVRISDGVNASRSTTTDSSGNYSLFNLEQSGFTVNFSKSGYISVGRGVTLTQNAALNVSLARMPAPAPAPAPRPSPSPTPSPSPSPSPSRVRVGAVCRDGTSSTATGSGACSSHGGVSCWKYSDGSCTNP